MGAADLLVHGPEVPPLKTAAAAADAAGRRAREDAGLRLGLADRGLGAGRAHLGKSMRKVMSATDLSALAPSTGPTPRRPERPSSALARGCTPVIMAPSACAANDRARLRNGGCAMAVTWPPRSHRQEPAIRVTGLSRAASTPAMLTAGQACPTTPRAARGMVRKVSKVLIDYPAGVALGGARLPTLKDRQTKVAACLPASQVTLERPPRSASKPPTGKRVTFSEDVWDADSPTGPVYSSKSMADGTPSPALKVSVKKMDALYVLRRCGKDGKETNKDAGREAAETRPPSAEGGDEEAPKPEAADEKATTPSAEEDDALMYAMLRDLNDTEDQLQVIIESLSDVLQQASDSGGARHATSVISNRILMVAQRKASLLHDVEERIREFRAVHETREQLLPMIVADKQEAPEALGGIRKFIASYTHSGHPADENKSQFARFVKTFKLPSNHQVLEALRALAEEAAEFWAKACLSEAEKGHGHKVLRKLFDVALGTGVDSDHYLLVRATKIINDRLANRVVEEAQERQRKDAKREETGPMPKVGAASELAEKIEQDMLAAVKEGVPENDERLKQAIEICKALRQKDGERKRLEGRQKRLEAAEKAKAGS